MLVLFLSTGAAKIDNKIKFFAAALGSFYNQIDLIDIFTFQLLETKSTDRSQTLLHFITNIIHEKYPDLVNFHTELHFVDKAALGKFTLTVLLFSL